MKIVLATGIYPPTIGGPATYVHSLAVALKGLGEEVTVVTFDQRQKGSTAEGQNEEIDVHRISMAGGPLLRWARYAKVLQKVGAQANVIYAFSSVSAGVPLRLSGLKHPKKVLRLGGDFLWERYTDKGGIHSLSEWHQSRPTFALSTTRFLLSPYNHVVFSSEFQKKLYEESLRTLPPHSVLENALPQGKPMQHSLHEPLRLLFFGRFVGFKNLLTLLDALKDMPTVHLTLVGEGPMERALRERVATHHLQNRVAFQPPVTGKEKARVFAEHDLLILPSLTEISPNTALEARAAGLPVFLCEETGLSKTLRQGMMVSRLRSPEDIRTAVQKATQNYGVLARDAAAAPTVRSWEAVAREHLTLFQSL